MKWRILYLNILIIWCFLLIEPFGIVDANIECYACESATNYTCTEFWDSEFEMSKLYLSNCRTG